MLTRSEDEDEEGEEEECGEGDGGLAAVPGRDLVIGECIVAGDDDGNNTGDVLNDDDNDEYNKGVDDVVIDEYNTGEEEGEGEAEDDLDGFVWRVMGAEYGLIDLVCIVAIL